MADVVQTDILEVDFLESEALPKVPERGFPDTEILDESPERDLSLGVLEAVAADHAIANTSQSSP